jgi:hypothetical protein
VVVGEKETFALAGSSMLNSTRLQNNAIAICEIGSDQERNNLK